MIHSLTRRSIGLAAMALLAMAASSAASVGPNCRTQPLPAAPTVNDPGPKTPWGDPDLQGVWSAVDLIGVPLDRDPQLGPRNVLTEEEFRLRRARLIESASPDNIEATNFGAETELSLTRSRQASLIVDPADGRRPPRTREAESRPLARSSFSPGTFDSVTDLGTYDRCIASSLVPAAQPSNTLEIVQGPGYVVIVSEVIHDARVVPLDGRPHAGPAIHSYIGDSRGRWDGRTLVVTTTNLNGQSNLTGNGGGRPTDRVSVVERYSLSDATTLLYEATIEDPGTWTRPWTVAFPRRRDATGTVLEYACHEGNYGVPNILRASRAGDTPAR